MEIEFLHHYEFPAAYIQTLQKSFGKEFLPLQEMGIKQGKLFEGNHLFVQAPTSSGKTMLAELLFLHHVRIPRSTLLLVPSKALANQRFHELKERYQPLGFKICLSTRDHPFHDGDIRRGDFHLAVLVYEKLLSLLMDTPTLLSYTGACVMDELHYVLDPKRGGDIDLLLSRIKQEEHIQRMGLSAIQMGDAVCEWLELQRLDMQQRPVELRQGVLCQGTFHYREFNSQRRGVEELPFDETIDDGDAMLEAAEHFYHRDESTLLFFPTRVLCYTAARKFAESIHSETLMDTDALSGLEDSSVKRFLAGLIPKQIAIHTSDLTVQEREVVEGLIQQNKIRVIFATSTLAEGINFPVTNVITTKHMYAKPASARANSPQPMQMPLSYDRLQNMTGRAGRLGYQERGRGMIVSCYPGEIEGLMNQFIPKTEQNHHRKTPRFLSPTMILKMTALFLPSDETDLSNYLAETFQGSQFEDPAFCQDSIRCVIEELVDDGFLVKKQTQLCLTRKGEITVSQGLSAASAHTLSVYAQTHSDDNSTYTEHMLFTAAMCAEMEDVYIPLSMSEMRYQTWTRELFQRLSPMQDFHHELDDRFPSIAEMNKEHHQACKKVMLCLDWINGMPVIDLEEKYGVYAGFLSRLVGEMAWLIHALSYFVSANQMERQSTSDIQRLVQQLLYGLPCDSLLWCRWIQTKTLNRQQVLQLIEKGFTNPSGICAEDETLLRTMLPEDVIPKLLQNANPRLSETQQKNLQTLQVDASRPDRVLVDGKPIGLTKLQARLLECLQQHANRCVGYERIMDFLWGDGLGDRKGLNRLKNQITQKCVSAGGAPFQNIIEVVPGTGLILRAELHR